MRRGGYRSTGRRWPSLLILDSCLPEVRRFVQRSGATGSVLARSGGPRGVESHDGRRSGRHGGVSADVPRLQRAIRDLHGLGATHLRSEYVSETFWGEVEVFAVTGHPKAAHAHAWEHETDEGKRAFVAVLGIPPVNSAQGTPCGRRSLPKRIDRGEEA